jgi:hypothetical protein
MLTTPTILIGITKKRMNRLVYSKNEIYYYVIDNSLRKRLETLFDALGNISSYHDYNCIMKKFTDLKPFAHCYTAEILRYYLSNKEGMIIAIDRITNEIYFPSKTECSQFSLNVNYPQLLPPVGHYIKDIMAEHFQSYYKQQMNHVIYELDKIFQKHNRQPYRDQMNKVIAEIKDQTYLYKNQMNRVLCQLMTYPTIYKEQMNLVMNELQYTYVHKLMKQEIECLLKMVNMELQLQEDALEEQEYEDYEEQYEDDFEPEETLTTIEEDVEESLESVIEELKDVMISSKEHLPHRLESSLPSLSQFVEKEENIFDHMEIRSFPFLDLRIMVGNDELNVDESELEAEVEEALTEEDVDSLLKELVQDNEIDSDIESRIDQDIQQSAFVPNDVEENTQLVQKVETIDIEEKLDQEIQQEIQKDQKDEEEKEEEKEEEPKEEEPKEEEPKEEEPKQEQKENLEDDIIELDASELNEPMQSSTLVAELFQKYGAKKEEKVSEVPEVPEPPKAAKSYLGSMWGYLGWRS